MSDKMLKMAGKTADNIARGLLVENDGTLIAERILKNISPTVILPDNELRDTDAHTTVDVQCDCYKYPVNAIYVSTSLDADIDFIVLDGSHINNAGYLSYLSGDYIQFTVPANTGTVTRNYLITSDDLPAIDNVKYLKLRYKAKTAPTKGKIKIEVVHKG